MLKLKKPNELAVSSEDVMISLPLPKYVQRRLSPLYRMNYPPHITIASGKIVPEGRVFETVKKDISRINPFRVELNGLAVMPTQQGNMLWAIANIDAETSFELELNFPAWNNFLHVYENSSVKPMSLFENSPYSFKPHVTLQYRKRNIRWLPRLKPIRWTQNWVEIVQGDTVVHRFVLGKRDEDN